MSKKRSIWKNRPDGKTIRRNSLAEFYSSRPVELLESPALRAPSRAGYQALMRIEIELRRHAGNDNGNLIVTKEQFIEFGLHPKRVAPALRELEALGIIRIKHGRGGNAEHRQPNRFLLNYLCGAVDAHEQITNTWKRFKTLQEAEEVARAARAAKDQTKVAYGRRNARRKNISRGHLVTPDPGALSDPETANSPGALSDPTAQGHSVTPLSILSGRGEVETDPEHSVGHNQGPPINDLRGMPRDLTFDIDMSAYLPSWSDTALARSTNQLGYLVRLAEGRRRRALH